MPGVGGVVSLQIPPGYSDPHNFSALVTPPPPGTGLLAVNQDVRVAGTAAGASTSGTVYLAKIQLTGAPLTITNVGLGIGTAGSTLTSNQCFAAVFDDQGNQIGVSADQSVAWTSTGFKAMALTGGPFTGFWPFVYVAMVSNGTTNPQFLRTTAAASVAGLGLSGTAMLFAVNGTGQTSMPASMTYSSNTITNAITFWAALS